MSIDVSSARMSLVAGAWYGDSAFTLVFPDRWQLTSNRPRTGRPLSDLDLAAALEHPIGQPPIRELARGKRRPLIVLDDLTRPTPSYRVIPILLQHLADAGIDRHQVTMLVGSGTHAPPGRVQMEKKVGPAALGCRLVAHDDRRSLVRIGRTSQGSPIIVNREVAAADLLLGVGGVYPQHSVGFGGGSKLLLGVLGRRSIVHLHYGHTSVAGSHNVDNDFRRDLDDMARIAGLKTIVTLHVDERRDVVRIVSGDHFAYYPAAVEFSRNAYSAPLPSDADVVISNAYPMDVSLTFARSKGMAPLFHGKPGASRILIAACSEGVGYHGLFPFTNGPRYERQLHMLRRLQVIGPRALPGKVARRAAHKFRRRSESSPPPTRELAPSGPANPIWVFTPGNSGKALPIQMPGMRLAPTWDSVLGAIDREQGANRPLKVVVYTCAPLQCLDFGTESAVDHLAGAGDSPRH